MSYAYGVGAKLEEIKSLFMLLFESFTFNGPAQLHSGELEIVISEIRGSFAARGFMVPFLLFRSEDKSLSCGLYAWALFLRAPSQG